jgi:hypothetical protein
MYLIQLLQLKYLVSRFLTNYLKTLMNNTKELQEQYAVYNLKLKWQRTSNSNLQSQSIHTTTTVQKQSSDPRKKRKKALAKARLSVERHPSTSLQGVGML